MIQAAIQILINNSIFQAAIGQFDGKYKVYPVVAPQGAQPPYCVIALSSLTPDSNCTDLATIDVMVYAKGSGTLSEYKQAYDISAIIRTALTGHSGLEANSGITCSFYFVTQRDGYDRESDLIAKISTYNSNVNV